MHGVQIITPIKINTINLKNELDRSFIAKNKIVKKPKNKINSNLNLVWNELSLTKLTKKCDSLFTLGLKTIFKI